MTTIGFIGGGNMAEALIKGIIGVKLCKPGDIIASDIKEERLSSLANRYHVRTTADNAAAAAKADILVLAVKPQNMAEALQGIKGTLKKDALVISIAAGRRVSSIAEVLGDVPIIRVMPNTPALIGEGASALFANEKAKPLLFEAEKIFSAVGSAVVVDREELIDAVTAISGSGPAYFFKLMESLIDSAKNLGLSAEVAEELVLQTAKGAAMLAVDAAGRGENPADLRRKVTSPGGTTEAALKEFEKKGFDKLIADATAAAFRRSRDLSK